VAIAAVGIAVVGTAAVVAWPSNAETVSAASTNYQPPTTPSGEPVGHKISRSEVLARAADWMHESNRDGYQYSQSKYAPDADHKDRFGTGNHVYRRDCSGFVAMAWHLDPSVNIYTGNILNYTSHHSDRDDMKPGDILLRPKIGDTSGHVVLFEKWVDSTHDQAWFYEQADTASDMEHKISNMSRFSASRNYYSGFYQYDNIFTDSTGAETTKPNTSTTDQVCTDSMDYVEHITLKGRRDINIGAWSCISWDPRIKQLKGWVAVKWSPWGGSDDSRSTDGSEFKSFQVHVQLKRGGITIKEAECNMASDINAAPSGSIRGCRYTIASPTSGTWRTDGWFNWTENGDSMGAQGPRYIAIGQPEVL
jgi:hypothetical protein